MELLFLFSIIPVGLTCFYAGCKCTRFKLLTKVGVRVESDIMITI